VGLSPVIVAGDRHSFWAGRPPRDCRPPTGRTGGSFSFGLLAASPGRMEAVLEHNLRTDHPLRSLFLAESPGVRPNGPTTTCSSITLRSCLEYARFFDLKRATPFPIRRPRTLHSGIWGGHGYATVRLTGDEMRTDSSAFTPDHAQGDLPMLSAALPVRPHGNRSLTGRACRCCASKSLRANPGLSESDRRFITASATASVKLAVHRCELQRPQVLAAARSTETALLDPRVAHAAPVRRSTRRGPIPRAAQTDPRAVFLAAAGKSGDCRWILALRHPRSSQVTSTLWARTFWQHAKTDVEN